VSRVDVPTLKCDRCGHTTQDTREMAAFNKISHHSMGGTKNWDLCSGCWATFLDWLGPADGHDKEGTDG